MPNTTKQLEDSFDKNYKMMLNYAKCFCFDEETKKIPNENNIHRLYNLVKPIYRAIKMLELDIEKLKQGKPIHLIDPPYARHIDEVLLNSARNTYQEIEVTIDEIICLFPDRARGDVILSALQIKDNMTLAINELELLLKQSESLLLQSHQTLKQKVAAMPFDYQKMHKTAIAHKNFLFTLSDNENFIFHVVELFTAFDYIDSLVKLGLNDLNALQEFDFKESKDTRFKYLDELVTAVKAVHKKTSGGPEVEELVNTYPPSLRGLVKLSCVDDLIKEARNEMNLHIKNLLHDLPQNERGLGVLVTNKIKNLADETIKEIARIINELKLLNSIEEPSLLRRLLKLTIG